MTRKPCPTCFEPEMEPFDLPCIPGWPAQRHQFDDESVWAVQAALATGRPLLVRGEPGTGKSQLARAVAVAIARPFLYDVITSRTEVTDLLWQFDAVARLGEAQVQAASGVKHGEDVRANLAPTRFLRPGRLWWAINWPGAEAQARESSSSVADPGAGAWQNGCVLLVDEIDKADSELPNALLESFANQSFQVPWLNAPVGPHRDQPAPLVVVTTNEERELPAAFLRRCMVLHLALSKDEQELKDFLKARARVHFDPVYQGRVKAYEEVLEQAATLLIQDRKKVGAGGLYLPGQAEYLDLCRAVFEIEVLGRGDGAMVLDKIKGFSLRKNPA